MSDTCAMCGKDTREDETHVLLVCKPYEGARKKLIQGAARIWGERKYKRRAAALLGPDSNRMTKSRKAGRRRGRRRKLEKIIDKLMKDFLITVEAQLESMTGNRPNKTERVDGGMRDEGNGEEQRGKGDLEEEWAWAEADLEQSRMDIDYIARWTRSVSHTRSVSGLHHSRSASGWSHPSRDTFSMLGTGDFDAACRSH